MSNEQYTTPPAFLTWLACVFGICGIHRFYLGQSGMGLLYLFTFGLFGVGQFVDLIRMNTLVDDANIRKQFRATQLQKAFGDETQKYLPAAHKPTESELRLALTKAAAANKGELSVTQGVIATGQSFSVVEAILDKMAQSGYVDVDNHPDTGVVLYSFRELLS